MPTLGESTRVGGAHTERGNEIVERLDAREVFGGQAGDLAEAAIHGANFLLCAEEHHAFLEPFYDVRDLAGAVLGLLILAAFGQGLEEDVAAVSGGEKGLEADTPSVAKFSFRKDFLAPVEALRGGQDPLQPSLHARNIGEGKQLGKNPRRIACWGSVER